MMTNKLSGETARELVFSLRGAVACLGDYHSDLVNQQIDGKIQAEFVAELINGYWGVYKKAKAEMESE